MPPEQPIYDRPTQRPAQRSQDFVESDDQSSVHSNWEILTGQLFALVDSFIQRERVIQEDPTITFKSYLRQRSGFILACISPFIIMGFILFVPLILEASTTLLGQKNSTPNFSNQVVPPVATEPVAIISDIFMPEVQRWESLIVAQAAAYGVDPNAVATVMQIESCGDPYAQSPSGASGLFQVMPYHFESHENMFDPTTNAKRGVAYLAAGIDIMDGGVARAMAGYNGGHSVALQDSRYWAEETRQYYYWGSGIYEDAKSGLTSSPRLHEWLQAGGAELCTQAGTRNIGAFD